MITKLKQTDCIAQGSSSARVDPVYAPMFSHQRWPLAFRHSWTSTPVGSLLPFWHGLAPARSGCCKQRRAESINHDMAQMLIPPSHGQNASCSAHSSTVTDIVARHALCSDACLTAVSHTDLSYYYPIVWLPTFEQLGWPLGPKLRWVLFHIRGSGLVAANRRFAHWEVWPRFWSPPESEWHVNFTASIAKLKI